VANTAASARTASAAATRVARDVVIASLPGSFAGLSCEVFPPCYTTSRKSRRAIR
jgi:hypothetical protein